MLQKDEEKEAESNSGYIIQNDWYVKYTQAKLAKDVDFISGMLIGMSIASIYAIGGSMWLIIPIIVGILALFATCGNAKVLTLGAINMDVNVKVSDDEKKD